MKIKLLQALQRKKLSISELAQTLNISILEALSLIGEINRNNLIINNLDNNYYLNIDLEFLDPSIIKHELDLQKLDYTVKLIEEIPSTNTYLLNNINCIKDRTILLTEYQDKGRGRNTKHWTSKIAYDFTFSIYFKMSKIDISGLPIALAVSLVEVFAGFGLVVQVKWPNDIYYAATKIAGVLVETRMIGETTHVVVGIGIDNIANFPRNVFLYKLFALIDKNVLEYQEHKLDKMADIWNNNCIHLDSRVKLFREDVGFEYVSHGINKDGSLILEKNGELISHHDTSYSLQLLA